MRHLIFLFVILSAPTYAGTCAGDVFDAKTYLERYKDLRDAQIGPTGACRHYELFGKKQGRSGKPGAFTPPDKKLKVI